MRGPDPREDPFVNAAVKARRLERVAPSRAHALTLLASARTHLEVVPRFVDIDPGAAFVVLYDAARKELTALLALEGLRPTAIGGHLVVIETVAQRSLPELSGQLPTIDRMRRQRNRIEYPFEDSAPVQVGEVRDVLPVGASVVAAIELLIAELPDA